MFRLFMPHITVKRVVHSPLKAQRNLLKTSVHFKDCSFDWYWCERFVPKVFFTTSPDGISGWNEIKRIWKFQFEMKYRLCRVAYDGGKPSGQTWHCWSSQFPSFATWLWPRCVRARLSLISLCLHCSHPPDTTGVKAVACVCV